MLKKARAGAVRKGSPDLHHRFRIGDRVQIIDISADLKDPEYDRKHDPEKQMRTAELFRFCLGRVFTVYGLDRHGHVELRVSNSPLVRRRFGNWHWIWSEPEFLKWVSRRSKVRKRN
jgi:hypothetical protein